MNGFTIVRKNLFRKKTRAFLLLVAIMVAFLIYGVATSFNMAFNAVDNLADDNRLVTVNKINLTQPMPVSYPQRVRAIEGVEAVSYASWFGGYYQEPRNFVPSYAVDAENHYSVYARDFVVDPAELEAFRRDRGSALVGEALARTYGWKTGDRVPLKSNLFVNAADGGRVWEFTIAGIVRGKSGRIDTNFFSFHHAYFNETVAFGKDTIHWMVVLTRPGAAEPVAQAIDAAFANSNAETTTDTEKAFGKAFARQFGNIALIVGLVVGAAFLTILMIVGNTMVMAVRERTRELAVLKGLGFPTRRIFGWVLAESMLLSGVGGLAGLALAGLFLFWIGQGSLGNMIPGLQMSWEVGAWGVLLMTLLGLGTGLVPAWNAVRTDIVTALGRD